MPHNWLHEYWENFVAGGTMKVADLDFSEFWGDLGKGYEAVTSDLSKTIGGPLMKLVDDIVDLDSHSHQALLDNLDGIFEALNLSESQRGEIRRAVSMVTTEVPWVRTIIAYLIHARLYGSLFAAYGGELGKVASRGITTKFRSDLVSPGELLLWEWRDNGLARDYYHQHGLGDDQIAALKAAHRTVLGVGDQNHLRRLGLFDDAALESRLKRLGVVDPADLAGAKLLRYSPLAIGDAQELSRRTPSSSDPEEAWALGGFEGSKRPLGAAWDIPDILDRAGVKPDLSEQYAVIARNLIGTGDLAELWRRGAIDDATLRAGAKQHGLPTELISGDYKSRPIWETLSKRLPDQLEARELFWRSLYTTADAVELRERFPDVPTTPNDANRDAYYGRLRELGFSGADAAKLVEASVFLPPVTDLVRMAVREVFTPDIRSLLELDAEYPGEIPETKDDFNKQLAAVGIQEDIGRQYWAAHWQLPSAGQMFEMFHRGLTSRADLVSGLKTLDYSPYWRERMLGISYRQIPRRTLSIMQREGTLTQADAIARYQKLGYHENDALLLAETDRLRAEPEAKGLARGMVVGAYKSGLYSQSQARRALVDAGYTTQAAKLFIDQAKLELDEAAGMVTDAVDRRELATATERLTDLMVRQLRDGVSDEPTVRAHLTSLGFSNNAIDARLRLAAFELEVSETEDRLDQYRRQFMVTENGDQPIKDRLVSEGLDPQTIDRIVGRWGLERETTRVEIQSRERIPTRSQITKWLSLGILDVDSWEARMIELRYREDDITLYLMEWVQDQKG